MNDRWDKPLDRIQQRSVKWENSFFDRVHRRVTEGAPKETLELVA